MKTRTPEPRLIETDGFPFEFLSQLAQRESWRKEIHRPLYHVHKWWATRLGSVFRGILLGTTLPASSDLRDEFYRCHTLAGVSVFDPFMGSGTTVGEAHKLGMTALGRDINPVAVEAVRTALGPLDRRSILGAFERLSDGVGQQVRRLYRSVDANARPCDVLYYFWVMQVECPRCNDRVDLFSSHIIARNAYPNRKPEIQIRCPACGSIFPGRNGNSDVDCPQCRFRFDATSGSAMGARATCPKCAACFTILDAIGDARPFFRLHAKLVLTADGRKEYLPAVEDDFAAYQECSRLLQDELRHHRVRLPELRLAQGHNTRQAMNYNFRAWADFFNDRQLLALGWLRTAIEDLADVSARNAFRTLLSGTLEFNNLFSSYKGEGTGAVRHMFAHHILRPERTPIEANVWGTPKSSGGFSNLFRSRLLRTIDYREAPTEVNGQRSPGRVCAKPFSGRVEPEWPVSGCFSLRSIYLSQGDSALTDLPAECVDVVVTDPPFFDNVHYSELADFFFAWQQINQRAGPENAVSTRNSAEVQDVDPSRFADKLRSVFRECHRVLNSEGLLVFTYHHSRSDGWQALAEAILGAAFVVLNSHPVKAEMSVATPKSQAKEPIQLDIILVCRKSGALSSRCRRTVESAVSVARDQLQRLYDDGFVLSRNDRKIVLYGQLLTAIADPSELLRVASVADRELQAVEWAARTRRKVGVQSSLFEPCE